MAPSFIIEVAGSGDTIVLIHGNGGDCRHWDNQFETLAKNYKVLRYDVRGYGRSSVPVKGVKYRDHGDLRALLEYLGISKAHIAGFSMGSGIAINFVLEYPEMSSSLIPVGPWVCGYNSPAAGEIYKDFGNIPSIIESSGTKAAAEQWIDFSIFNSHIMSSEVKNRIIEIGYDYSFWHFLNRDPIRIEPDAVNQVEDINVPTLIITSEYDVSACKQVADLLEEEIPNATKIDIANATHYMFMEKPAEFNKEVLQFLSQITD